eukprot:8278768-Alexandrium_andersonii.AAC.1
MRTGGSPAPGRSESGSGSELPKDRKSDQDRDLRWSPPELSEGSRELSGALQSSLEPPQGSVT